MKAQANYWWATFTEISNITLKTAPQAVDPNNFLSDKLGELQRAIWLTSHREPVLFEACLLGAPTPPVCPIPSPLWSTKSSSVFITSRGVAALFVGVETSLQCSWPSPYFLTIFLSVHQDPECPKIGLTETLCHGVLLIQALKLWYAIFWTNLNFPWIFFWEIWLFLT
jgi:hypothetical protein